MLAFSRRKPSIRVGSAQVSHSCSVMCAPPNPLYTRAACLLPITRGTFGTESRPEPAGPSPESCGKAEASVGYTPVSPDRWRNYDERCLARHPARPCLPGRNADPGQGDGYPHPGRHRRPLGPHQQEGLRQRHRRRHLLDKKTGANDLGFGLHVMDFLLAPGWRDDGYPRDAKLHGDLPKHYVEGPQICTQAKQLPAGGRSAARASSPCACASRFTQPAAGFKAGSLWEQTMVFQPGLRYVLSAERITSANDVDDLFYRIDMPGHIRHDRADDALPAGLPQLRRQADSPRRPSIDDFAPDAKFLYQRRTSQVPARMIRAYQVKLARASPAPGWPA